MQSGCAINPWSTGQTDVKTLSNLVGLSRPNEKELLKILQALPVKDVFRLQEKLKDVQKANVVFEFCYKSYTFSLLT